MQRVWCSVVVADARPCRPSTSFTVTSRHGYISSAVADTTQRGTTQCPWIINARRGQRINVTLWDFGSGAGLERSAVPPEKSGKLVQPCQAYAVIRERLPARSFTVSLLYVWYTWDLGSSLASSLLASLASQVHKNVSVGYYVKSKLHFSDKLNFFNWNLKNNHRFWSSELQSLGFINLL